MLLAGQVVEPFAYPLAGQVEEWLGPEQLAGQFVEQFERLAVGQVGKLNLIVELHRLVPAGQAVVPFACRVAVFVPRQLTAVSTIEADTQRLVPAAEGFAVEPELAVRSAMVALVVVAAA